MINYLYETFPEAVTLNGKNRRIITDFKDWIRFYDMLRDDELTEIDKFELMQQYYIDPVSFGDLKDMHKPLLSFYRMENEYVEGETNDLVIPEKPAYDYKFDSGYIIAGFLHDYSIDLTTASMHWWKFRLLLNGLSPETEFKQRVMYRSTDVSKIKDEKERKRIQRIQRQIAIPYTAPTDYETGGMFW